MQLFNVLGHVDGFIILLICNFVRLLNFRACSLKYAAKLLNKIYVDN